MVHARATAQGVSGAEVWREPAAAMVRKLPSGNPDQPRALAAGVDEQPVNLVVALLTAVLTAVRHLAS